MEKKYICYGDYIISQGDGDTHYISARRVSELYRVNPQECFLIERGNRSMAIGIDLSKYIILTPREDGKYNLANQRS